MAGCWQIIGDTSKDALIAKYEALPAKAQKRVDTFIEFLSKTTAAKSTPPANRRFRNPLQRPPVELRLAGKSRARGRRLRISTPRLRGRHG